LSAAPAVEGRTHIEVAGRGRRSVQCCCSARCVDAARGSTESQPTDRWQL